jgi:hypothetical protein
MLQTTTSSRFFHETALGLVCLSLTVLTPNANCGILHKGTIPTMTHTKTLFC